MVLSSVVVQREVLDGFVWSAVPVRVIEDGPTRTVLYRANGTTCWWPAHPKEQHPHPSTVTLRAEPWLRGFAGMLTITGAGADFSVTLLWNEGDWSFWGWYIDFVRPYRRTPIGWDFADLYLDLVVSPDGDVRVKDEQDLDEAVARGDVTPSEADAARSRCTELAAVATQRSGIFNEPWPDWRPVPSWSVPRLRTAISEKLVTGPTPADDQLDVDQWVTTDP